MANKKSAQKRILQVAKKTEANTARKSRIRTFIRKLRTAIDGGQKDEARTALTVAQSEIMKGVTKGVLHKNTAARTVSRLSAAVKKVCLAA
ncbi:MAG: small subunit ribosomal protein S20 [Alphaproteobacteria bacterium]|jgi:small subunit ribosomal protein S20